jgi:hypothetical protein
MALILSSLQRIHCGGLCRRVAAVLGGGIIFGLVVFFLWIQPREVAGANYAVEFAWDQLLAGAFTVILALIFGRYAVDQVRLAREAIENDRQTQAESRKAETRRILLALLNELHHNRTTALMHEGRLLRAPLLLKKSSLSFQRRVFDELTGGPLWGISLEEDLWSAVSKAYWDVQILEVALQPEVPWWAAIVGALTVGVLESESEFISLKDCVGLGLLGFAMYVGVILKADFTAKRNGTVARSRQSIEAAMDSIYQVLSGGTRLPWAQWDRGAPAEMQVAPPR